MTSSASGEFRKDVASAGPADARLDALFAQARAYPPAAGELAVMLRGVPQRSPSRARRYWRLGVAALAVTAAAGIVLAMFLRQPAALAIARVVDAMRAVVVVEQTSSNGWICWESPGRCFAQRPPPGGGAYKYRDQQRETIATYDPARKCIIVSSNDAPGLPNGISGAFTLAGLVQEAESFGQSFAERWRRTDRTENGRPIVMLESKLADGLLRSVTIDGISGRIMRMETREGVTTYAYPNEVPRDLYDLGVPRDVPVIDGTAPAQVLALREKVRARARIGYGAYRLVSVDCTGTRRVISDGPRVRVDGMYGEDESPRTLAEIEARAAKYDHMRSLAGQATATQILIGDTETTVNLDAKGKPTQHRVCPREFGVARFGTLAARIDWMGSPEAFFGEWGDEQCAALGPDEHGWVGFSIRGQGNGVSRPYYRERWYDPARGYVLCQTWHYDDPAAPWQLTDGWRTEYAKTPAAILWKPADAPAEGSRWEVLRWAEFRPGQWYPAVSFNCEMVRAEDGTWHEREATPQRPETTYYNVLRATPLDSVEDSWFEIPAEWLKVPAGDGAVPAGEGSAETAPSDPN